MQKNKKKNPYLSGGRLVFAIVFLILVALWAISAFIAEYNRRHSDQSTSFNNQPGVYGSELMEGQLAYVSDEWIFTDKEGSNRLVKFDGKVDTSKFSKINPLSVVALVSKKPDFWQVMDITILDHDAPSDVSEAKDFVSGYINAIQSGDYQTLRTTYWSSGVEDDIISSCQNPFGDDAQSAQDLWRKCGFFKDYRVQIIEVEDNPQYYYVRLQFSDRDGKIVTQQLRPNDQGPSIYIQKTTSGLKTADWRFF